VLNENVAHLLYRRGRKRIRRSMVVRAVPCVHARWVHAMNDREARAFCYGAMFVVAVVALGLFNDVLVFVPTP